jgi:hypothetical protein
MESNRERNGEILTFRERKRENTVRERERKKDKQREKETGERVFNPAYFLTNIFFSFLNIFGSKGDFSV